MLQPAAALSSRPLLPFGDRRPDPRLFQIGSLSLLLAANILFFDLGARAVQSGVTVAGTLAAQLLFCRLFAVPFDWRSPLITGLSLSLLLRANDPLLWCAAGLLAMGSKFLLRVRGKHLFNPAAFAIAVLLLLSPALPAGGAWVSPGQWGVQAWLVLLIACLGLLVLTGARRMDTALVFLGCYLGLLLVRALYLGDPLTIPLHQAQSGSLLLFTFFMVTDPRSTPDRRAGRVVFAAGVAALAYWLQFRWQVRPGLYFALMLVSLATPVIDLLLPAERFRWQQPA